MNEWNSDPLGTTTELTLQRKYSICVYSYIYMIQKKKRILYLCQWRARSWWAWYCVVEANHIRYSKINRSHFMIKCSYNHLTYSLYINRLILRDTFLLQPPKTTATKPFVCVCVYAAVGIVECIKWANKNKKINTIILQTKSSTKWICRLYTIACSPSSIAYRRLDQSLLWVYFFSLSRNNDIKMFFVFLFSSNNQQKNNAQHSWIFIVFIFRTRCETVNIPKIINWFDKRVT